MLFRCTLDLWQGKIIISETFISPLNGAPFKFKVVGGALFFSSTLAVRVGSLCDPRYFLLVFFFFLFLRLENHILTGPSQGAPLWSIRFCLFSPRQHFLKGSKGRSCWQASKIVKHQSLSVKILKINVVVLIYLFDFFWLGYTRKLSKVNPEITCKGWKNEWST